MPIAVIIFPVFPSPQTKRKRRDQGKSPQTLNQRNRVDLGKFLLHNVLHQVNSQMNLSENISNLTLLALKRRGFLIQRLTFKHHVLAAVLKPLNRTIVPIAKFNS